MANSNDSLYYSVHPLPKLLPRPKCTLFAIQLVNSKIQSNNIASYYKRVFNRFKIGPVLPDLLLMAARLRTVGRLCSAPPPYLKFRPLFFGLYCSKTLQKHGFLLIFDRESLFYACNCTQNHYSRVQKYYTRGLMTKNDKLETYPM